MGVDASIFACTSKKYYYFDRVYNLDLRGTDVDDNLYRDIAERLFSGEPVAAIDALYLCDVVERYWSGQPGRDGDRALWAQSIRDFIQHHPDDMFFVATDHGSPSSYEIEDEGGYTEYLTAKDCYQRCADAMELKRMMQEKYLRESCAENFWCPIAAIQPSVHRSLRQAIHLISPKNPAHL